MEKKKVAVPLVCHGHSRPVVDLFYSPVTPDGYFLISASKGKNCFGISLSKIANSSDLISKLNSISYHVGYRFVHDLVNWMLLIYFWMSNVCWINCCNGNMPF